MAEPKKGSCRICGNEASVCDACHMVSLASAEYEIKTRGEEVLELICKMECSLCNMEGMPSSEPEFGSWFHFINDRAYRCECELYRQAYDEEYGGK